VEPRKDEPMQFKEPLPGKEHPFAEGMTDEFEVAEEVLEVWPLEDEDIAGPVSAVSETGFLGEQAAPPAGPEEPSAEELPAQAAAEEAPFFGEIAPEETFATGVLEPVVEEAAAPATAREPVSEQAGADDFTTDTLAELYIAQGFFEKAIDIYQRMVAEHPDSKALRDKLERVKAMAGPASEGAPAAARPVEEPLAFAEPKEYVSEVAAAEEEISAGSEFTFESAEEAVEPGAGKPDVFGEAREYRPPAAEAREWTPPAEETVEEVFLAPEGEAPPKEQSVEFEPREYIPPSAALRQPEEQAPVLPGEGAERKATIDRLEQWLSNIKKEK
jgi:hypothetical protein